MICPWLTPGSVSKSGMNDNCHCNQAQSVWPALVSDHYWYWWPWGPTGWYQTWGEVLIHFNYFITLNQNSENPSTCKHCGTKYLSFIEISCKILRAGGVFLVIIKLRFTLHRDKILLFPLQRNYKTFKLKKEHRGTVVCYVLQKREVKGKISLYRSHRSKL